MEKIYIHKHIYGTGSYNCHFFFMAEVIILVHGDHKKRQHGFNGSSFVWNGTFKVERELNAVLSSIFNSYMPALEHQLLYLSFLFFLFVSLEPPLHASLKIFLLIFTTDLLIPFPLIKTYILLCVFLPQTQLKY